MTSRDMRRQCRIGAAMTSAAFMMAVPQAALPAQFTQAELYFELNDTDGDLGFHSSIDGGPYPRLEIVRSPDRTLLVIEANGGLSKQGLTQLFFESAEPAFSELSPERFFKRFPEGPYEIFAERQDGKTLKATVVVSHVMAAPPSNITLSGVPAVENCDVKPLPLVSKPVVIDWDPVTQSHPTIGKPGKVDIALYQLFVEREGVKLSLDLPPDITRFSVPPEVIALGNEFKFEIIARTATGNNTAIESCFKVK